MQPSCHRMTRSLVLALSVSYYARLQNRVQYEKEVYGGFQDPLSLPGGIKGFREEIKWYDVSVAMNTLRRGLYVH